MKRSSARAVWLFALLGSGASCAGSSARADVILYDNLGNGAQGYRSVTVLTWEAQRFNSASNTLALTSATLNLDSESGGSGTFFLQLDTDAAGQPGTALATLFTGPDPFTGPFPQSGNILFGGLNQPVVPNTNYWLVLGENSGASFDLRWGSTSNLTGTGSGFQTTNATTNNQGGTWSVSSTTSHVMQLTATAAPEPSSLLLGLFGGCALLARRWRRG